MMKKLRTSILGMWPLTADAQVQAAKYGRSHTQKQLDFARTYGCAPPVLIDAPTAKQVMDDFLKSFPKLDRALAKVAEAPRTLILDSLRELPADRVRGVPKFRAMLDDAQPWPLLDMLTGREEGIKPGELLIFAAARGPYTGGKTNLAFLHAQMAMGLAARRYVPEAERLKRMFTKLKPVPWFLKEEANTP